MSKRQSPDDLQVALVLLRALNGWSQKDFAEAAGLERSQISHAESGRRQPTEKTLGRLLATAGVSASAFRAILAFLRRLRSGNELAALEADLGSLTLREVALALESAAGEVLQRSPNERLRFQDWPLVEKLCTESTRATATDANRALELASIALRIAERTESPSSSRIQGYAWAHIGNARRVAGDLAGAEAAFLNAWRLWETATEPKVTLAEAQILSLEASLRRDQRRLSEALELLDRALGLAHSDSTKGRLLLIQASTLEQMLEPKMALEVLERALPLIDPKTEARDFYVLQFTRAVTLLHLSRVDEAAVLVPEVREMAAQLGNELDLIRVRWLEARVAVGQGHRAEAMEALTWIKAEFATRNMAYDMALASLELAVLYLGEGRTGEVKTLAEEMRPVFQSQGVHREALAALRVFSEAAACEAVTLDLARRLVAYLERARHDPELRFGG
jgi:transcriptional regulator with XRE-family HTH domain